MEPFLVCENLVKIFKVAGLEVVALQGLNLTVQPGELMGIVGASGSGKSTLLNIVGGLDRPSAGRLTVNGRDLLKAADSVLDEYRRTEVGFVWQQTARNLMPYLTAQENVELPMTIEGVAPREKRAWARELLQIVGLWEHRQHRLAQLSGGQQQRVAIAVALANRPKLLLGDEPTGEVDNATAQEILGPVPDDERAVWADHDHRHPRPADRPQCGSGGHDPRRQQQQRGCASRGRRCRGHLDPGHARHDNGGARL